MAVMLKHTSIVQAQPTLNLRRSGKAALAIPQRITWRLIVIDLPAVFAITGEEVNDYFIALNLIAKLPDAKAMVADKGYDSE